MSERSDPMYGGYTREYWRYKYAGQAMEGLLSNSGPRGELSQDDVNQWAVEQADGLLAELEKPREADENT